MLEALRADVVGPRFLATAVVHDRTDVFACLLAAHLVHAARLLLPAFGVRLICCIAHLHVDT